MTDISRRSFLEVSGTIATLAAAAPIFADDNKPASSSPASAGEPWYRSAYRRAVIDMHIPDWDQAFLSKFDATEYADMLVKSRAQSIVCYCQSHVGLFNYPTKVGKQHAGLGGRNVMKEMIDRCHERNIAVVLYTSLIFDRWCGDEHPEWRMRTWDGKVQGEGGRHGVLCVNSPYREYVRRFVTEICQSFDFEGIRFDMTFWPWLCYCQHCQARFDKEVGGEIPKTVDWLNEKWVAFQRCRERWLVEFASIATETVRQQKPTASVEHQSSTYPLNWMFGVTIPLAAKNDFLQGDFYGDQLQGSFVRKLLEDLTPKRPFGYETSFSVALKDHTAMKSEALLEAKASAAISDSAAFIFIDAIDPVGTVNHRAHERMGQIFDRFMPYYEHLGGERVFDMAVYYSLESKFNFTGNGRPVSNPDTSDSHTEAAMQAASRLIANHVPFGVVTRKSLAELGKLKVLILPNVNMMQPEECDAIREWVRQGGSIIASGGTSLVDTHGRKQPDFMLADVFGVSLVEANWQPRNHYLAPTAAGQSYFPEFDSKYPAFCSGYGFKVKATQGAEILATTTWPWPAPNGSQFASIHSDPPWTSTEDPEIVVHRFGQGTSLYCASVVETMDNLRDTYVRLVRRLCPTYRLETEAPGCVEATLFHQPDRNRYVLSLVNFQKDLPNLPIDGIKVRLMSDRPVQAVKQLGHDRDIMFQQRDGSVAFHVPRLETLAMFAIE